MDVVEQGMTLLRCMGTFGSTGLWRRPLTQAQLWLWAQRSSLCPTLKGDHPSGRMHQ